MKNEEIHRRDAEDAEKTKVIINGDDFGKSPGINEAVIRSFKAGTLTSCSLMVSGDAFGHAVRLAKEHSALAVGIHLVTVQGKAVLPHTEIPDIVDREGHFSNSPVAAGLKYYFSKTAREQLTRELAAQFQRFHGTGLKLSHVDSHLHMHVHPVIFSAAIELAQRYGVWRMRVPQDDFRLAVRFHKRDLVGWAVTALVFGLLANRMKRRLLDCGFSFPEQVYGHFFSGRMSLEYVLFVLDHLSKPTNEIYFHPAELESGAPVSSGRCQSIRELDILTNEGLRKRLHDPGITLTNYFELSARQ